MEQFEYLMRMDLDFASLNELGNEGWELVSVVAMPTPTQPQSVKFYFKRRLETGIADDGVPNPKDPV